MAKKINKKSLDKLWSKFIRLKANNTCFICGKTAKEGYVMNAHHAIVRKAQGNYARYDIFNGVCLCVNCHIFKLHGQQADFEFLERYTQKINELFPEELKEKIRKDSKIVLKNSDLIWIKKSLEQVLKELNEKLLSIN